MGFLDKLFGRKKSLQQVGSSGSWRTLIQEPFPGAWQHNQELQLEDKASFYAVFACISLISKDVGKLPLKLKEIKSEVSVDAKAPRRLQRVLRAPNSFQTWQQFNEHWTTSLLLRGNAYVLKRKDVFGELIELVCLNPDMVTPLVDDYGNVFYQLKSERLAQTGDDILPASEILHDRINAFYHPLIGLSPITACALASKQGLAILTNSANFFGNGSNPGGILTAPAPISKEVAMTIREQWRTNYGGANYGKVAVLGDGLTYSPIGMTATDSQLIEQLALSARIVCTSFNVPPFKIGVTDVGATARISDLNEIYYSDCLQAYIEAREALLNDALGLIGSNLFCELDLSNLIRMDTFSKIEFYTKGLGSGIFSPNEARKEFGYLPVEGGESPMVQQQNYSLAALAKRDAMGFQEKPDVGTSVAPEPDAPNTKNLWKGVFSKDAAYSEGEFVTHKGSLWNCQKDHLGEFSYDNFKLCSKEWV